ncbi:MAG TPA: hypothetical protein VN831_30930 [Bradyrhizobium sp.]|nr:hypothetical protein [Bradyrhizobium sp.]
MGLSFHQQTTEDRLDFDSQLFDQDELRSFFTAVTAARFWAAFEEIANISGRIGTI